MTSQVTLLPSARRLMDSLREIGYDLPSAIADIIDNSITAGARTVDLQFVFDGADSWVLIADDGSGMTGSVLEEAMRYGTERTYDTYELGRFGLGLKTASLSQCRRLTVASRRGRERRRIEIRQWDLDHVLQTNRWEALRLDVRDAPNELVEPLLRRPGTTVLWEGLDRVLDYRTPNGVAAQHGLAAMSQEVGAHVAMVFHRFLSGEARRRRRVRFTLNGAAIDAWDPYARSEGQTRELTPQQIPFATELGTQSLVVRPYVLPAQERFSSAAAHARASGPQRWNRQQGFYFYRNDRLIQAGGWNRLRTSDEHTKLARISVDLPAGSEALFRVNVAKMRVSLPGNLRGPMMAIASGVAAEAGARYRRGSPRSRPTERAAEGGVTASQPLVSTLSSAQLDVLSTLIDVVREEFREEPDIVRRLLSRIQRLPSEEAASETNLVTLAGSRAIDVRPLVRGTPSVAE